MATDPSQASALDTCGACIAFIREGEAEDGPMGRCRLRPELGAISHTLPYCPKYVERGTGRRAKPKKRAVRGRARGWFDDTEVIVESSKLPSRSADASPAPDRLPSRSRPDPAPPRRRAQKRRPERARRYGAAINLGEEDVDTEALRALIADIFYEEGIIDDSPMADKWVGGTVLLQPADANLQPKEIPIDAFFHKVVMVRDRLRVLEQKINASKNLDDKEKVDLQAYVTRIYGSLTTFNVLFKDKADQFVGAKS